MSTRGMVGWLAASICSGAVLACTSVSSSAPVSSASPLLSRPLPRVARTALDGRHVDTHLLTGKRVVVKFFAKFCAPCKETLPELELLARSRQDIAVIGIAEDERESDARELARAYGLSFPIVHDREQVLAGRYRVTELPATFIADERGMVRWVLGTRQRASDASQALAAVRAH